MTTELPAPPPPPPKYDTVANLIGLVWLLVERQNYIGLVWRATSYFNSSKVESKNNDWLSMCKQPNCKIPRIKLAPGHPPLSN